MIVNRILFISCILLLTITVSSNNSSAQCTGNIEPVVIKYVEGKFDDVWDDLKRAIEERGLVISNVSYVGEMVERTGKDMDRTKKVFNKAWVMEFCSASLSRDMFEKNPHLIAFCPYKINVYTLPENGNRVFLSYRTLLWKDESDRGVLIPVERLLGDIINDVIRTQKEYQ